MSSSTTPKYTVYESEPVSLQPILHSARSDPRSNASNHNNVFLAEQGAVQHKIITLERGLNGMVGISFARTQAGPYTVIELSSQGAAHRTGLLKSGDLIHSIDQQSLYNLDSQQVSKLLTGPPDSILSLVLSSQ
jgi:C-terminal processing protease CtpA/Prc